MILSLANIVLRSGSAQSHPCDAVALPVSALQPATESNQRLSVGTFGLFSNMYCVEAGCHFVTVAFTNIRMFLQKVEEHQVREVLKCIIHTIIFNRALGHVSPRDMDLQLINVSYVEVADDDIERQVEEGLRKVEEHLKTLPRSSSIHGNQVRLPNSSFRFES